MTARSRSDRITRAIAILKNTPAVRHVRSFQQSVTALGRGYAYARGLPAISRISAASAAITPLEAYFNGYHEGPGLWKWRHYFSIYDRHLARFRGRPVRVLEIGVFGGGSLTMWREYFGPRCEMYGVDIDPACETYNGVNVSIFIGDQADPAFWDAVLADLGELDVVLDDGGHQARQQIVTLEAIFPHIAPGGVYLCEDIHGAIHPFHAYVDGFTRPLSAIPPPDGRFHASNLHQHVASVHRYPLVTVIEKPLHQVTHFEAPRHGTVWPAGRERG